METIVNVYQDVSTKKLIIALLKTDFKKKPSSFSITEY